MKKQQHEKTSQDSTLQAAKEYVQRQMAIMEEHGKAPKLSADARPSLVPPDMDKRLDLSVLRVPEHCRRGLLDYLRYGVPPGHFLQAVLSNDLREACSRADEINRRALYDYVFVLYNDAPGAAWGSPDKVKAWINAGMERARQWLAEPVE